MKPQAAIWPAPAPAPPPAGGGAPAPRPGNRLWLALAFPALPLAALGPAPPGAPPQAVSEREGRAARLLWADRAARAAGVQPGMDAAHATVLCPALQVLRHDPLCEAAALEGLAVWSGRYSSQASLQPPRGLLLEIGASLRLFHGLGPLLDRVRRDLRALEHRAVEGVAPTPTAAWLLARAGIPAPVTVAARLAGALAPVPVACMDLPERAVQDLHALGVRTFGGCARLPRDGLAKRFGPDLLALLDRALGRRPDPRAFWRPPQRFQRRLDLAVESADRELLLRAVQGLLQQLAGFLRARGCGAGALELQLAHRGAPATRLGLELVTPAQDPQHLLGLLAERLERLSLQRQVLYVGLKADRLVPLAPATGDLLHAGHMPGAGAPLAPACRLQAERLVERLGARLGREAVRALVPVADHRPERASAQPPWHRRGGVPARGRGGAGAPATGMPLWLLPRPRRLDGAGSAVALDGPLQLERGPCRIESGWWDGHDVARDYYVARSACGTRYWIFRERRAPRCWYLHGIFA